jgi:ubiquinone/menaquinone biosynthesis C-methylase UbiE
VAKESGARLVGVDLSPVAVHHAAATVIGVDNSPAMLTVARANLAALSAGNVTLAEGELDALPLADGSVDVAVANMVLYRARWGARSGRCPRGQVVFVVTFVLPRPR